MGWLGGLFGDRVVRRVEPGVGRTTLCARLAIALVVVLATSLDVASASPSLPLRTLAEVPLGGSSPRFDYQTIDPSTHRLYVAHQGDGTIVVVDLVRRRVVARISGLANVHGVLVVPAFHRLFATATARHELVTLDTRTNRVVGRSPAGVVPDGIAYDSKEQAVFVSDERPAGGVVVANARTGRTLGSIRLGGSAGNVQYDPGTGRVLVGVETHDELAVIDPATRAIVRRVPLAGCDADHSLLVDAIARLLVVGCSANGRLEILNADSFREVGRVFGAGHVDVLALDPTAQRVYAASEDGIVTIIQLNRSGAAHVLGQHRLTARAHSVAVDPTNGLVYLPLGRIRGRSILRVAAFTKRG